MTLSRCRRLFSVKTLLPLLLIIVASQQFAILFLLNGMQKPVSNNIALLEAQTRRTQVLEEKKLNCIPPIPEITSSSSHNNNITSVNSSLSTEPLVPRLYLCGWILPEAIQPWKNLFPNHSYVPLTPQTCPPTISTSNDILITSESHTPACQGVWVDRLDFFDWIPSFAGKVVVQNGESRKVWLGPDGENVYHLGYYPDSIENRTMRFRALQMSLLEYGHQWWTKLLDPAQRPVSKRERFLIYASSNCVTFRQMAVERLAHINVVDRAGSCRGWRGNETRIHDAPVELFNMTDWRLNKELFSMYRFCLVMENTYQDGYITEKILNAFLAGCVPIWYGTTEAFDIFNKDAFVYYNTSDPRPAVKRVKELESNETAYDEIMKQPILANGEATIREYFSFTKDLGGGHLVKKLHRFLKSQE